MKALIMRIVAAVVPLPVRENLNNRYAFAYFFMRSQRRAYVFALTGVWL